MADLALLPHDFGSQMNDYCSCLLEIQPDMAKGMAGASFQSEFRQKSALKELESVRVEVVPFPLNHICLSCWSFL